MDLERVVRQLRLLLVVNVALTVANAAILYVMVFFVVDEPADVLGDARGDIPDTEAASTSPTDLSTQEPRVELEVFLRRTTDLLDRTARKNGADPGEFVPTDAEIEAALATGTAGSEESRVVLQKLREGYDLFDLPWPVVIPRR